MDYDSDQYNGLTDKENMTAWDDEVNGTTVSLNVKMFKFKTFLVCCRENGAVWISRTHGLNIFILSRTSS